MLNRRLFWKSRAPSLRHVLSVVLSFPAAAMAIGSTVWVFIALASLATLLPTTIWASGQLASCNPNWVFHLEEVWLVLPTGTDDTANLQCAFDHAVIGSHSTVQLSGGTYHTGQIVASGFVGTFRGVGTDETIIQTLDRPLSVTYLDFFVNPPTPESGSNPWPSVFAFVGGDIVISDLSLYVTENSGTTGWTFTGLGVNVYELAHGFVVVGSEVPGQNYREANAALYRVRIEGLQRAGTLYGFNLINATYYEGFLGADTLPLRGTFDIHDSHFRQVGGTNLYNLYDAQISITRNSYRDSFEGMDVGNLSNTSYEFADNEALNISLGAVLGGVYLYGPFDGSALRIRGNDFTGVIGPYFDNSATFSGNMSCQVLKNAVEDETSVGIYLGTGTTGCLVVCKSPTDTVTNTGTNNKLVGCQGSKRRP